MRGLGIAFLFAAVVIGSLALWARSLGKEVHAIASLPPATVLYPDARVATHPDEDDTIWVRRAEGPWQEYGTEFVYWEM